MFKNKFMLCLCVFTIVFCSPVIIANAVQTYADVGGKLGVMIYDATHEEINLEDN